MKSINTGILLNLLFSVISGKFVEANPTRQRYVAHYPALYDPFVNIADVEFLETNTIFNAPYNEQDWVFNSVNLTDVEYNKIRNDLIAVGGIITKDEYLKMVDDTDIISIDDPDTIDNDQNFIASSRATQVVSSPYLNDAPRCQARVDDVEFIVIDSLVYANHSEFSDFKLTIGKNYAGSSIPCLDHGSKVISIITGKTAGIITHGKRSVVNIPVFDCSGNGFVVSVINAISDAMARHKENLKIGRRTVVNFSGTGANNPILNRAATSLVQAGVPFTVAAGNKRINACDNASPANAAQVFTTGATVTPGNVPAWFTNWAPTNSCIPIYLPGTISVVDVNKVGVTKLAAGTSFAAPIAAALIGMELEGNLKATPAQVQQTILAKTVAVLTPNDAIFSAYMNLLPAAKACSITNIFSTYSTIVTKNRELADWYTVPNINRFCVKFTAQFTRQSGAILIGLGQNSTDTNRIKINIGLRKNVKNKFQYLHSITSGNQILASAQTTDRVINVRSYREMQIKQENNTLLIQYRPAQNMITLFSLHLENDTAQAISFSRTAPGQVIYKNAVRC